jgi:hypothetical protein
MHEFKFVKHGEQPGEVSRRRKIQMREMRLNDEDIYIFPWQSLNRRCAKAFRRYIIDKGKTVQRRRDQQAINDGLINL